MVSSPVFVWKKYTLELLPVLLRLRWLGLLVMQWQLHTWQIMRWEPLALHLKP
jgi:hypothetical protein